MNCHEVRQHLGLYLDSEGDTELHFRINDHLGMCPDCAEWFAKQQRLEQGITERLAAGTATPDLWGRVLARAGVTPPPASWRRRLVVAAVAALAAAVLLAVWLGMRGGAHESELARMAADRHERWAEGGVQPELPSASDKEVEDHLRKRVHFPVHCPPRRDVRFALQGAGVCELKGMQAAHIVGQVEQTRVSIFVLARGSLDAFPHERDQLAQGGGRRRCREGNYQMVAGVTADNVVVVIGAAPPEALERLLKAYGNYHEDKHEPDA
jgi:anti-sigma factor RsiW